MSIKRRLSKLEDRLGPTTTSDEALKDLESLAYDLKCSSEDWPDLKKEDDIFTNLKRIIPAPGEEIKRP